MKWYIDALKNYGVFSGRSRRKAYWMFTLFDVIFAVVFSVIDQIIGNDVEILNTFYTLATIIPTFAVSVRRMHDTGHSGWWIFFPIVNFVILCIDSQPGSNKYGPNPKG